MAFRVLWGHGPTASHRKYRRPSRGPHGAVYGRALGSRGLRDAGAPARAARDAGAGELRGGAFRAGEELSPALLSPGVLLLLLVKVYMCEMYMY